MIRWLAGRGRAFLSDLLSDPITMASAGVILLSRGLSVLMEQLEDVRDMYQEVREVADAQAEARNAAATAAARPDLPRTTLGLVLDEQLVDEHQADTADG